MGNRAPSPPSLPAIFLGFVSIGLMSFGGGLAAWIRREVVQRRGWLDEQQFLSGYALSQLVPGATNVNLSVFIGTQLRGWAGAISAFWGLTAVPLAIVLVLGCLYFASHGLTFGAWFSTALAGMGAVAIGLNLGTGIRLMRRNISGIGPLSIMAAVIVGIGILGFRLPHVLGVVMPISLAYAWWTHRQ